MKFFFILIVILTAGLGISYWQSTQGVSKYSLEKPPGWRVATFNIPQNPGKAGFYFVSPDKKEDFKKCKLTTLDRDCLDLANLRLIVDKDALQANLSADYYYQTVSEEVTKNDKVVRVEKITLGEKQLALVASRVKGPDWMNYQSVYVPLAELGVLLLFTTNDFSSNPIADAIKVSPLVELVLEKWL